MAITLLRQNDPRWGGYPFCPGGVLSTHGCGPTSMAMAVGDGSPVAMADYLTRHGYASSEYGTDHYGIIAGIKSRGYNCWYSGQSLNGVMRSAYFDTLINHMASGKVAILLMGGRNSAGGACRTSYWCNAGHYVTACGFSNNQIKIQDPAWNVRDGYHSVYGSSDDALNGNIKYIYLTDIPWKSAKNTDYKFSCPQKQIGQTGTSVGLLQRLLKSRGLYDGKIDNSYGEQTRKAVIAFQKAVKITQDGVCGPTTWQWLIPLNASVSGSSVTFTAPQIQYGYKGQAAYFWQELLRGYGYITFPADMSFGPGCREATLRFQRDRGLIQDAVAGPGTYKKAIGFQ